MKNYLWVIVEKFGNILLKTIGMIILARMLTPDDFGLFGMVYIFVSLGNVIVDSGMGGALIRKEAPTKTDYSTVFLFNLLISLILWLTLSLLANHIADFYDQEELLSVVPLLSAVIVIRSLSLLPITKMTKELEFKVQANISLLSYSLSFCIAVFFAYKDYGVYSLVILSLVEAMLICCFSYYKTSFYPLLSFSVTSFKEMYAFGSKLMLASLIRTIYESSLSVIFGKSFGINLLGYYYQANKVNSLFITTTTVIVNKASFPILVKDISNDKKSMQNMRSLLKIACWICFFISMVMSLLSLQIVGLLFGDVWSESGWMLGIISFAGFGMIVEAVTRSFLKAYGFAGTILKLELYKRLFGLIIIFISIPFGIKWVLVAYVLSTVLSAIFNLIQVAKKTQYKLKSLFKDILTPLLYSTISYVFANFILSMLALSDILTIVSMLLILVVVYSPVLYSYKDPLKNKIFKKLK